MTKPFGQRVRPRLQFFYPSPSLHPPVMMIPCMVLVVMILILRVKGEIPFHIGSCALLGPINCECRDLQQHYGTYIDSKSRDMDHLHNEIIVFRNATYADACRFGYKHELQEMKDTRADLCDNNRELLSLSHAGLFKICHDAKPLIMQINEVCTRWRSRPEEAMIDGCSHCFLSTWVDRWPLCQDQSATHEFFKSVRLTSITDLSKAFLTSWIEKYSILVGMKNILSTEHMDALTTWLVPKSG